MISNKLISKILLSVFVIIFSHISIAQDNEKRFKQLRVGTLNAEFLNFKKVHLKYSFNTEKGAVGFPFFFKPGDDTREKLVWSGLTSPGKGAKTFFERFDDNHEYRKEVLLWGDNDFRMNKLRESSQEVANVIKQMNVDLLVLTEVGKREDLDLLLDELKSLDSEYEYSVVCDCSDRATFQKVAILSRHPILSHLSKIPGREGFFEELDDDDSEKSTAISKGIRALLQIDDEFVYLYGVHFKSERGFSEADGQRVAQASIVRRSYLPILSTCVSYKNERVKLVRVNLDGSCARGFKLPHVIVAGDLNEKRGQPALRRVRGLDDYGPDLIQTGHLDFFEDDNIDTRWTYEFQGIKNQIDHILVSASIKRFGGTKAKLNTKTIIHENHKATDHNGLVFSITYPEER